jgi:hypothetical protein
VGAGLGHDRKDGLDGLGRGHKMVTDREMPWEKTCHNKGGDIRKLDPFLSAMHAGSF